MAGIYIHIPFCKQACTYCNFHFSTSLKNKKRVLDAIIKEIENFVVPQNTIINTIYFGGGTPSILESVELDLIFRALSKFNISPSAEITLEANPDDITPINLNLWHKAGVNRLSVGVQSFQDEELRFMNRAHGSREALESIKEINDSPIHNFSVDIIYGSQFLSDENLKANLEILIKQKVPHISCYALTVESKTALHHLIQQRKVVDVDPAKQSRQFLLIMSELKKAGYNHYEISNFSLPGKESRHNRSYWQGLPYFGFGPAAHSYNGSDTRSWNVANNIEYAKSLEDNSHVQTKEILTDVQQMNEMIMISLRTSEGLNASVFKSKFGEKKFHELQKNIQKHLGRNHVVAKENHYILTEEGNLFADGIAADLFLVK